MKPRLALLLLALVGLLQLAVPGYLIYRQEATLRLGKEFRLLTAPADPYDAFRGRYVQLRFQCENLSPAVSGTEAWKAGDPIYVSLSTDAAGFGEITRVGRTPPPGESTIRVKVFSAAPNPPDSRAAGRLVVHLPCDRFYMAEQAAPKAGQKYLSANLRGKPQKCWATVRVLNGTAALEDVLIAGVSITKDHP